MTISPAASSRYAQAGNVRIHYHDVGCGPPLLCLHGAGPGASAWGDFAANVAAFAEHYRVVLVDLPQYGTSDKIPIAAPKLSNLARIVRDFMDAIELERAAFIGYSYGGMVALKLAIDEPERVTRVVVIGSTPVATSIFSPLPAEGVKRIVSYYEGDGPSRDKMRAILETLVYDTSIISEDVVQERYAASLDADFIRVHTLPQVARQHLSDELERITAPTLIVWGMDDRAGPLDAGLMMTRMIPHAQMHIFTHCGHWVQAEHAQAFNQHVLTFLRGRPTG